MNFGKKKMEMEEKEVDKVLGQEEIPADEALTGDIQPDEEELRLEDIVDEEEENPARKLAFVTAALELEQDKYLRLAAEFDNFRKRTLKEKAELILNGGEKSIESILPVVDDLERAVKTMEQATEVEPVKEGIELILGKFLSILAQNGVRPMETKDEMLNVDLHDAIAVVPAPEEELRGRILDCVQRGYMFNEKVLRHAKVVVGE
jgi:molecular chaperone GrpE